ncbi:MAG TPA: DUF3891 family protein [Terriglobales bacterium]|nr:DUF3891 family protein [Terriglobales bacterium]
MILRSVSEPAPADGEIKPVWIAIEHSQRRDLRSECWMIPQPSHAALAGDIAAQLAPNAFGEITADLVRIIALHDAGWSLDDADVIQESRAKGAKAKPYSFIAAIPRDTVAAWTGSIEIAGKGSPLGSYLVSRHFAAIAELNRDPDPEVSGELTAFLAQEHARQQSLRKKLPQADAALDRWLAALQFCDLLSLYIACGLAENVEFPQGFAGKTLQLRRNGPEAAILEPYPFREAGSFHISAILHPKMERVSSQIFTLAVSRNG